MDMARSRLYIARDDILDLFDRHSDRVFRRKDLREIVEKYRAFWRLAETMSLDKFVEFLCDEGRMKVHRLEFPNRTEVRYAWGDVSTYEIAQSLNREQGYFTHYTAVSLHRLTEQSPSMLYFNQEQAAHPPPMGELEQGRIRTAFQRSPRVSKNVADLRDMRICQLSGKYTANLAVVEMAGPGGERLRTTNIERTLIDIAVRPFYAGGVFEVLKAYRTAADRVSTRKLVDLLGKLSHVYPYHQAIGFYMDRSEAYTEGDMEMLRSLGMDHDFYLTYKMGDVEHSDKWRLFFPKGF
jgi:predicted transcriptional regulator of viral defense system